MNSPIAKPLASFKVPISITDLSEETASLSREHQEELILRQYGSHLVVFTEGEVCGCADCLEKIDKVIPSFYSIASQGMVVCRLCGNKRCPHASSHKNACTRSNVFGQTPELLPEYVGEQ